MLLPLQTPWVLEPLTPLPQANPPNLGSQCSRSASGQPDPQPGQVPGLHAAFLCSIIIIRFKLLVHVCVCHEGRNFLYPACNRGWGHSSRHADVCPMHEFTERLLCPHCLCLLTHGMEMSPLFDHGFRVAIQGLDPSGRVRVKCSTNARHHQNESFYQPMK